MSSERYNPMFSLKQLETWGAIVLLLVMFGFVLFYWPNQHKSASAAPIATHSYLAPAAHSRSASFFYFFNASIFAATIKSFLLKPPTACVVSSILIVL